MATPGTLLTGVIDVIDSNTSPDILTHGLKFFEGLLEKSDAPDSPDTSDASYASDVLMSEKPRLAKVLTMCLAPEESDDPITHGK